MVGPIRDLEDLALKGAREWPDSAGPITLYAYLTDAAYRGSIGHREKMPRALHTAQVERIAAQLARGV